MAQMNFPPRKSRLALACGLWLASHAQAEPPAAALQAEMAEQWQEAADVYRQHLQTHPDDLDNWQRLSDVEAKRGDARAAAAALGEIARLRASADAHAAHSRALASAGEKAAALKAIQQATTLAPKDAALWLAQAQLANWNGDIALAEQSLLAYQAIAGDTGEQLDELARVRAWQGRYREADELFARYLELHPQDHEAQLDRIRIKTWRGDYAGAVSQLDRILEKGNERTDAQALRARALAWAGRLDEAHTLNAAALAGNGDDYDANFTEALLQRQYFQPVDALPWLDTVLRLKPDAKESRDLEVGTRMPLRSRVSLSYTPYQDSDELEVKPLELNAQWRFADSTWLMLNLGEREYAAPASGPFAPIGGGDSVDESRIALGLHHALNPSHRLELHWGRSELEDISDATIWNAKWSARFNDDWALELAGYRDRIGISPRAMSLDIVRRGWTMNATWTPNLRWRVDGFVHDASQSDDNKVREFALTALRKTWRGDRFNWDLGATAWWTSFEAQLANGYYDPDHYRRVQGVASGYVKFNDNHGLNMYLALGLQRDESLSSWKGANDVALEGVFGIFSDWQLKLRAAYTDRRQAAGAFDGRSYGAVIERRF